MGDRLSYARVMEPLEKLAQLRPMKRLNAQDLEFQLALALESKANIGIAFSTRCKLLGTPQKGSGLVYINES